MQATQTNEIHGASDLSRLSARDLSTMQREIKAEENALKERKKNLNKALFARYSDQIAEQLKANGKDFGKIHLVDSQIGVEVDVPKKVDWDQDKLRSALDCMDQDTARHYAKVKVTIGEREFNAAPPEIKSALIVARTVTPGDPRITFEQTEG